MGFSLGDLNPIKLVSKGGLIDDALRTFDDKVLGGDAADAAQDAAAVQMLAGEEASTLFDPFRQLGESGLSMSGFLTDPNQQFEFLQSNPLFQMGLDNLNRQTLSAGRASGRGAGATDTQMLLNNNALLAASPLISQQKQSIGDLINTGLSVAGSQGNLRTGQGAAQAGGIIGAANAEQAGIQNLLSLAGTAATFAAAPSAAPGAVPGIPTGPMP